MEKSFSLAEDHGLRQAKLAECFLGKDTMVHQGEVVRLSLQLSDTCDFRVCGSRAALSQLKCTDDV